MAAVMLTANSRYSVTDQSITARIMLLAMIVILLLLLGATKIQKVIGNVAVSNLLQGMRDFYLS